ncbi:hypothetical protein ACWPKO_25680 (plasmid) [Coraliomargarita sp. W4R53]
MNRSSLTRLVSLPKFLAVALAVALLTLFGASLAASADTVDDEGVGVSVSVEITERTPSPSVSPTASPSVSPSVSPSGTVSATPVPADAGALPVTGLDIDTALIIGIAGLSILVGVALLAARRRARAQR